ncbi:MAG: hypothetical protein HKN47_16725 [Pirellulaceae bacterium]|nr:hypothetical protein [Pirellulaceae bacterium]
MSARICFLVNGASNKDVWIEKPVIRIGSHPDNDICIPSPDLAEHALTLEYRQGNYNIYNRTDGVLDVGAQSIASGAAGLWSDQGELRLQDGTVLRLELFDNGAPAPRPKTIDVSDTFQNADTEGGHSPQVETAEKTDDGSRAQTILQLAVIAGCFLVTAVIVVSQFVDFGSGDKSQSVDVRKLSTDLASAAAESNTDSLVVLQRLLQDAEFARLRGDQESAIESYALLRSILQKRKDTSKELAPVEDDLLKYVLARLAR